MYRPGGRSPGGGFDKARTESDATRSTLRSRSRNRPSARTRRRRVRRDARQLHRHRAHVGAGAAAAAGSTRRTRARTPVADATLPGEGRTGQEWRKGGGGLRSQPRGAAWGLARRGEGGSPRRRDKQPGVPPHGVCRRRGSAGFYQYDPTHPQNPTKIQLLTPAQPWSQALRSENLAQSPAHRSQTRQPSEPSKPRPEAPTPETPAGTSA